jgi:hypothetical protein
LPDDDTCFASLVRQYEHTFRLIHCGPRYRIFKVTTSRLALKD